MVLGNRAFVDRHQHLTRFFEAVHVAVGIDLGLRNQRRIALALCGVVVTNKIGVRARPDPITKDQGFVRSGRADDDVGLATSGLQIVGDFKTYCIIFFRQLLDDRLRVCEGAPPDHHAIDRPNAELGADNIRRKIARTKQQERLRVLTRQQPRREPRDPCGPPERHARAIDQRQWLAVLAVVQHDLGVQRRVLRLGVVREIRKRLHRDQLIVPRRKHRKRIVVIRLIIQ